MNDDDGMMENTHIVLIPLFVLVWQREFYLFGMIDRYEFSLRWRI